MAITQTYNLDLVPNGPDVMVKVSQYDKESRIITFNIYNQNELYTIPGSATATVRGTKADNTGFEYPCTINGSTISFPINQQMTVFNGKVLCEVRIAYAGELLGTANFILFVEKTALSDDTVISETELPLIQRAVDMADEIQSLVEVVERVEPLVPSNTGTDGQVLTKDGSGSKWANVSVEGVLPTGGTSNQLLRKLSSTNYDVGWFSIGRGLQFESDQLVNKFSDISNQNLDDVKYNYQGYSIGTTGQPSGTSASCILNVVARGNGNQVWQMLTPYNSNTIYTRTYNGTTWNAWELVNNYFRPGDNINFNPTYVGGLLTASQKLIRFTIPLSKPVQASSCSFTSLYLTVRGDGITAFTTKDVIADSEYSVSSTITPSGIGVDVSCTNALTITNNTALAIQINSSNLVFA